MNRLGVVLFVGVLILGFLLRLYRFDNPIADWHSWRQADTSSVSRKLVTEGFDVMHPRYQDLSPQGLGVENPNGYRFVEFPVYNVLQAAPFVLFGTFTLEEWGRLVTIFASLLAGIFIFLIVRRHASRKAAFFAFSFYILLPYNIYYGRVILPDPLAVTTFLGGIYFFDKWIEKNRENKSIFLLLVSGVFISISVLLKPFALFFTLPIIYLAWKEFGFSMLRNYKIWIFSAISIVPFILWRMWMSQFPEGIPANAWLFNDGNIRFKGAFFYWIFADRIGRLILGYWAVALFVLGFLRKLDKNFLFFLLFFASSVVYFTVIAKGNINHDYYQILIVPSLVIFVGLGVEFLLQNAGRLFPKLTSYSIIFVCSVFTFLFGWYFIRDYFNINNFSLVEAGREADRILPKDAKVIAPYGGDTALLYHVNRDGWAFSRKNDEFMMSLGATHMVVVNPTKEERERLEHYEVLANPSNFLILNIRVKK